MARFALIKDGSVACVIVARADFLERADARWREQYDEIREVVTDARDAQTEGAIVSRDVEPGARFVEGRAFERVARVEPTGELDELRAKLEQLEARVDAKEGAAR